MKSVFAVLDPLVRVLIVGAYALIGWLLWQDIRRHLANRKEKRRGASRGTNRNHRGAGTGASAGQAAGRSTVCALPYPRPRLDLDTRQVDEPIRAWKKALLTLDGGRVKLRGVTDWGADTYPATGAVASCNRVPAEWLDGISDPGDALALIVDYSRRFGIDLEALAPGGHTAPDPNCGCGFYAVPDRENLATWRGVLLEVELYGRIVRHSCGGLRAEKQRVLAVHMGRCDLALGRCENEAATFAVFAGSVVLSACWEHSEVLSINTTRLRPSEVAEHLGTEVRWAS